MTNHPLTDEMCETLSRQTWLDPDVDVEGTIYDMRAAYDRAIDCFSDWIRENGYAYVSYHYELGAQPDFERMIADFNQAILPQEDN